MRKPSSLLRSRASRLHRPSPAMMVALAALFLSLGGASYAAVMLPAHSVGSAQLKTFAVTNPKLANNSVGYRKIMPGSVGTVRIDKNDVQLRVTGTCMAANQAMTSVNIEGGVTCGSTSPSEFDTGVATAKPFTTTATPIASMALAGGTEYMVQAAPYITVAGNTDTSAQTINVSCTLASGTATTATETRMVSIYLPAGQATASASIPLTVIQPESPNSTTASLTCMDATTGGITGAGTLSAEATVYATTLAPPTTATTTTATTTTTTAASVRP
jgi:hypothetical protein